MPNSTLSPLEAVDSFGQPKKPEPSADNSPQAYADEKSEAEDDKSLAAEKTSSADLTANKPPQAFHCFSDLPPEIRAMIWAMAWPTRVVWPYESKPAPPLHCRSHPPCKVCETCSWRPPVRTPAVMQACHEARLEAQNISKPLTTWMFEMELLSLLKPSMSPAQRSEFREKMVEEEEMLPLVTRFNANTDVVVLCENSFYRFSQLPGPPNHNDVLQAALDPELPVLLCGEFFEEWDAPGDAYDVMLSGLQALYHRYLKTRTHIYIGVGGLLTFVLTEEGWEKAIREGLFSGHYEEMRLIPVDDEVLINKYEGLRDLCFQHTEQAHTDESDRISIFYSGKPNFWHNRRLNKCWKDWTDAGYFRWISNRLTASRENLSDAQLFMLQIADFLMWDQGLGHGRGEEIMELDGHLKKNHPLVQEHDLRLPDFTAVLTFQAKRVQANNCAALFDRLPEMRPKFPEED